MSTLSQAADSPILIVPYMWIGDFVRCHSVVKLLKARFPARPVDLLATHLCAPLLDYMPGVRQGIVWDLPRGRLAVAEHHALARRLRAEHYGMALIMPRTWKSALAPFLYASSAATYGDGAAGFSDDCSLAALKRLRPMNLYGFSKHLFDLAVVDRFSKGHKLPPQWAGLKFFNVFGPNEYHKGAMMSVLAKVFDEAKRGRPVQLFKSYREGVGDGEQRRDFIYVKDAVGVVDWLLETPAVCGIYNVGSGTARSFREMMVAMFEALGRAPNIDYVEMPPAIQASYQYFTQAPVENLRRAGYPGQFAPLEQSVRDYVTNYLDAGDRYR